MNSGSQKGILSRFICSYYDHIFQFLFEGVGNVAVCGRLNVNVALNRPTFQISTFNAPPYGGEYLSSRAVDGNADPVAWKVDNSCFMSKLHDHPWWAVDLGAALVVYGVLFTSRAEGGGKALGYILFLFFSRPRSEGLPHHGRTFSIYPCPLSF